MSIYRYNPAQQKVYREWIDAAWEKGANCVKDPERWQQEPLPSEKEASRMCKGCPLLGEECKDAKKMLNITYGVMNGLVVDVYGFDAELEAENDGV